jgi:hypothetical protein
MKTILFLPRNPEPRAQTREHSYDFRQIARFSRF